MQRNTSTSNRPEAVGSFHLNFDNSVGRFCDVIFIGTLKTVEELAKGAYKALTLEGVGATLQRLEYWDDDPQAAELVRAAVAYLDAYKGRGRAGSPPGVSPNAAGEVS